MEPTLRQWMWMQDPENKPMWMRADGSTRGTAPYKVEPLLGDDDQTYHDFVDIGEEPPLTALK
eukprot:9973886-Prorocentrum_lima.AAC.1